MDVSEPQEPEKSCTSAPEVLRLVPRPLNVTVALEDVAVNLYHTSSSGVPAQDAEMPLLPANQTVPETLAPPTVMEEAPLQSSLLGGAFNVMLKAEPVAVPPSAPLLVEYTRM